MSDAVHGIEDILMHNTDVHGDGATKLRENVGQLCNGAFDVIYLHQHHHNEHILKHGLSHVHDIGISFCTYGSYLCKNTHGVLADYGNYSFHEKTSNLFLYILSHPNTLYNSTSECFFASVQNLCILLILRKTY